MPRSASAPRRPQQARSRDTEERIVRAVTELLDERPLDELSVAEIAARAGVSVGGFYARFAGKEEVLLRISYESYVAKSLADAARVLAPERWEGAGLAPIVEAYCRMMIDSAREHMPVVRELVTRSRNDPTAMFSIAAYDRFSEGVHEPFRRLVRARFGEVRHPDPERALRIGFFLVASALREAVFSPHMRPALGEVGEDELVTELTRLFCGYLGASLDGV
ncbi:MAG TPA: helix-turn-helix domain-containing protein [Longimicrobium sp.]|nr:helix-turn-helix domain-containing protein [Longimicrobium sp.]